MELKSQIEEQAEVLARRGLSFLVTGLGAFFAYFNSAYGWVSVPEYKHVKGAWLKPLMPALEPFLPQLVIALGIGSLAYATYCFWQYWALTKAGG